MAYRRERALTNGSSQKRNMRSTSPSTHDDHAEPALQQQQQHAPVTSYSFALVNWGGGGSSENAGAYVSLATEVVQSCERIALDARPDVLRTLRYLVSFASVVGVTAIIGYSLVQIVPHLKLS